MNRLSIKEKISLLEEKGLNWLEISDILEVPYEMVREISEGDEK